MGCSLSVEEGPADSGGLPALNVTGNRCQRGSVYAREEIRAPKRVVTATCAINGMDGPPASGSGQDLYAPRRIPVKTAAPCPKEKITALLNDIYNTTVHLPVQAGDTIIENWKGEGINVVAARSMG
ncbi:MAG: DUF1667 domain-containing protein [Treponema sp.]|nr:DUF1667 domain-containing protein [Treponema sp.]